MRIIGHIEHAILKITAFKMDNKLSIKFESGLFEQTYKFRTSDQLNDFEDIKKLVDGGFVSAVLEELKSMNQIKNQALSRFISENDTEDFEEII
jgi:hypothetical protein